MSNNTEPVGFGGTKGSMAYTPFSTRGYLILVNNQAIAHVKSMEGMKPGEEGANAALIAQAKNMAVLLQEAVYGQPDKEWQQRVVDVLNKAIPKV
jgi:hypothetical protein